MTTIVKYVRADGSIGYGQVNENPKKHYARAAYRHAKYGVAAVKQHPYLAVGAGLALGVLAGYAIGVNKTASASPAVSTGNFYRGAPLSTFSGVPAFSAIDGVTDVRGRMFAAVNQNAERNRRQIAYPAMGGAHTRLTGQEWTDANDNDLYGRRTLGYGLSIVDNTPQRLITRGRGTPGNPVAV